MKSVLQTLQSECCREREISENEKITFSNCEHLQRYYPALDLFKISESSFSHKNLELPSKYFIDTWVSQDNKESKIWNTIRSSKDSDSKEETKTFVKCVHLLNPIDMIKETYICPEHPLLPQSENTWKKTLLKLHNHNNQAYVDTVCNFVLSRFRELDLTPHCVYFYGATTGINKKYQFNVTNEYDTYRQCRWFWRGMKSHSARLTISNADPDLEEIPNFQEIYNEITKCPFDDINEPCDSDIESMIELGDIDSENISDVDSIKSFSFDNIEENATNTDDIFEINKKSIRGYSAKKTDSISDSDLTEVDSNCDEDDDDDNEDDNDEESIGIDVDILLEIPNMPVILIYQEAHDGVMDSLMDEDEIDGHERGSQGWEARWIAWLFQVIAALSFLQDTICFTHNDLHSNNIIWRKTNKKFLYYKSKDGIIWRIPTYGKIFSIIDFGRSIFRVGKHLWISDDHWPDQEAGDQYNFGPFFNNSKPKVQPNPSFDLCRLAVSLIDGLFDEKPPKKKGKGVSIMSEEGSYKVFETSSPLFNLLWCWTVDKDKHTIYEDEDGNEKYEGFDLYIRIAHDVNGAIPKDQIHKPVFQQFKWKQKIPDTETVYSLGT